MGTAHRGNRWAMPTLLALSRLPLRRRCILSLSANSIWRLKIAAPVACCCWSTVFRWIILCGGINSIISRTAYRVIAPDLRGVRR